MKENEVSWNYMSIKLIQKQERPIQSQSRSVKRDGRRSGNAHHINYLECEKTVRIQISRVTFVVSIVENWNILLQIVWHRIRNILTRMDGNMITGENRQWQ